MGKSSDVYSTGSHCGWVFTFSEVKVQYLLMLHGNYYSTGTIRLEKVSHIHLMLTQVKTPLSSQKAKLFIFPDSMQALCTAKTIYVQGTWTEKLNFYLFVCRFLIIDKLYLYAWVWPFSVILMFKLMLCQFTKSSKKILMRFIKQYINFYLHLNIILYQCFAFLLFLF